MVLEGKDSEKAKTQPRARTLNMGIYSKRMIEKERKKEREKKGKTGIRE